MATIEKKDVNPVVVLLANICCLGVLGYILMGQTTKAVYVLVVTIVLSFIGVGVVVYIMGIIDAYQVAQALAAGEEVDENEYKFELLYKVMNLIDKSAIYKG